MSEAKLIILMDFDGVILTQKALEYTALKLSRINWYNWQKQNTENLRLIDYARLFEQSDSDKKRNALRNVYRAYRPFIPNRYKRIYYFIRFRRTYPKYEIYEELTKGMKQVLIQLKKRSIPLGIVSNTAGKRLKYFRKKLGLDDYFSVFISRDDIPYRKPHPYSIIKALVLLKRKHNLKRINKNMVYFIGDLPTDIECAKNANVNSIALLSGHGTEKELRNIEPTIVLKKIKDLLEIEHFKKFLLD